MRAGLVRFELPVDAAELADRLLLYVSELHKWNRAYNLTAVRDPQQMLPRHIYDSLSVLPFIRGKHIADVGTGAGLPGIPLALCCAEKTFTLLDSNGKKARFVEHIARRLELPNVAVVQARIEQYQPERRFDTVVSRAFASLRDFAACCEHTMEADARLVAMKGKFPDAELAALEAELPDWRLQSSELIVVPELAGERHVLVLQRHGES